MRARIVVYTLMLLLLAVNVLSAPVDTGSNAFVAAEVSKQMDAQTKVIVDALTAYQDENFRALDGQMRVLMADTRNKVVIGGIGAILVANALVALAMMHYWKKYSYQEYVRTGMAQQQPEAQVNMQQEFGALNQYQQPVWNPQTPSDYIGTNLGQNAAAQVSEMNRWQTQPAYRGAWATPMQDVPEPPPMQQDVSWMKLKPEGE